MSIASPYQTNPLSFEQAISTDQLNREPKSSSRKKRTNSRPCDACAIRRVRCDIQTAPSGRCSNCANHDVQCTNVRIRHKSGPKRIKQKTRASIQSLITNPDSISGAKPQATFSLDQLVPFLQVYQTWYYCIWPVVSVALLTSTLSTRSKNPKEALQLDNVNVAEAYVLSCSVCAAMSRHKQFMKSTHVLNFDNYPTALEYAKEAERITHDFDLKAIPSMNSLLTSFFLHAFYSNVPNGSTKGILYLRDAITLSQILGLHEPSFYINKPRGEAHRYRKIYYQLLVTERFISFGSGIPVLLEPKIPIPSLEDEEYSGLLLGFTELADVFSTADRQFFEELHSKVLNTIKSRNSNNETALRNQNSESSILQDFLQNQPSNVKRQRLYQLQKKLDRTIANEKALLDSQKVNIFVSRSWIQSMGWLLSSESCLVNASSGSTMDDYFSVKFPLKIANDFLIQTTGLPEYAFESNGPGVSFKLLEVADSLHHFASLSTEPRDSKLAVDQLSSIFKMIVKFKSDMELPKELFLKIANSLQMRHLDSRQPSINGSIDSCSISSGSIEMLDEDVNDLFPNDSSSNNDLPRNNRIQDSDNQQEQDQLLPIDASPNAIRPARELSLFNGPKPQVSYTNDLMKTPSFSSFQNYQLPLSAFNNNNNINDPQNVPTNLNTPPSLSSLSPFYGTNEMQGPLIM